MQKHSAGIFHFHTDWIGTPAAGLQNMKTKIKKEEFDALPDSLKVKFKAEGDEYVLQEEDVAGLKKNKQELLDELKGLKERYGDIDPEAAKTALEAAKAAEDEKLTAAGEFDTLKQQLIDRHANELKIANEKYDALHANLRREQTKNLLTAKGVKPDRVKSALAEGDFDNILELVSDENGFALKKKVVSGMPPKWMRCSQS